MHDEGNSFLMRLTGLHIPGKLAYVYDLIKDQKDLKSDSVESAGDWKQSKEEYHQILSEFNRL